MIPSVCTNWFIYRIQYKRVVKKKNRLSHFFRTFDTQILTTDGIITDQLEEWGEGGGCYS